MNKEATIQHMIKYIEAAEREQQAAIMTSESKTTKADIVSRILKELECEMDK